MPFNHQTLVKIINKTNDQIIKNFEDELVTKYYLTNVSKDFNINGKTIEIMNDVDPKLIVFTSYDSIVVCRSYKDNNLIDETRYTSNEYGITVFDDIPQCDRISLIFYYISLPRDGLMSTVCVKDENDDNISVYKSSVAHKKIKLVDNNPGWEF